MTECLPGAIGLLALIFLAPGTGDSSSFRLIRDRHDRSGLAASTLAAYRRVMARYEVNPPAVEKALRLIEGRQYVLQSEWGAVQPDAAAGNAFLERHSWEEFSAWHLGLTVGANDETKARYAFVFGDFRRLHRSAIIACIYRAAEWRHKQVELAAHELLQELDRRAGIT